VDFLVDLTAFFAPGKEEINPWHYPVLLQVLANLPSAIDLPVVLTISLAVSAASLAADFVFLVAIKKSASSLLISNESPQDDLSCRQLLSNKRV
jgi:hypothetical protein